MGGSCESASTFAVLWQRPLCVQPRRQHPQAPWRGSSPLEGAWRLSSRSSARPSSKGGDKNVPPTNMKRTVHKKDVVDSWSAANAQQLRPASRQP
jgi:hypothetical protein